ncbi:MAG: ribosome silencing factor [Pseudomonadota bacterium]|nr:ribosome silencing factor [Pseudomonadota bacterium]
MSKDTNTLITKEENAEKDNISAEKLLVKIQSTLDDYKAENIVTVGLKGKSDIADYLVIASGRSSRQISSIAEALTQTVKKNGVKGCIPEGMGQGDWILLDAGDIIVHLFRPEVREFYNLEKMWDPDMVASSGPVDF